WGPVVPAWNAYTNDKKNGATMLSIPVGHTADALCYTLGEMRDISATLTSRRRSATIIETGEATPMTSEDQVAVTGSLDGATACSTRSRRRRPPGRVKRSIGSKTTLLGRKPLAHGGRDALSDELRRLHQLWMGN